MTCHAFVKQAAERLEKAGIGEAEADALELLLFLKKWSRSDYFLYRENPLEIEEEQELERLLKEREKRIPLQHITGTAWFYGRPFTVSGEVLIPRFDTEILVQEVLRRVPEKDRAILDLCTGSGCIAVTLKLEGDYASVAASDISPEALKIAKRNADALQADICFYESDLFREVPGTFDVIVSNPPYITAKEMEALEPEVKDHDPALALFGGTDGLDFYRRILSEAAAHLKTGGLVFFEIGALQAEAVLKLLHTAGFTGTGVIRDLAGHDRVVYGRRPEEGVHNV